MELKNKKIAVTGGAGFFGSHIVEEIKNEGGVPFVVRSSVYDLTKMSDVIKFYEDEKPDAIIHAAAVYGGFRIHEKIPATIFDVNMRMLLNLFSGAIDETGSPKVEKILCIGSGCAYPTLNLEILDETYLWNGPVDPTIRNYGTVKRLMQTIGHVYRDQFNLNSIVIQPATLYGERDTFNPERSHVPSALIRRFVEATEKNQEEVTLFGEPETVREFIYVKDAAKGVVEALKQFERIPQVKDQSEYTLNLGNGIGTSIDVLAKTIAKLVGYTGKISYNHKSAGQKRRTYNVDRMKEILGFTPKTSLEEGLKKTIQWYLSHKNEADNGL
jgi:GDP-L-fucose synthase